MAKTKKIVIVVDFQYDFLDLKNACLPIAGGRDLIPGMVEYLGTLDPEEVDAVVFTQDWHDADWVEYMPDGVPFPKHCVKHTVGAEVVVPRSVVPAGIDVYYLKKNVFSMWEEPTLYLENAFTGINVDRDLWFERRDCKNVEISGVALNICVSFALKGFVERGYNVTVVSNLTKGIDLGGGENDTIPCKVFANYVEEGSVEIF